MNQIPCVVKGCPNVYETNESVSPDATFICKDHAPLAPDNERFQDYAFDSRLRGTSPSQDPRRQDGYYQQ